MTGMHGDRLPPPAQFKPYPALADLPNIIVDGAPLPSTLLTLSHWPVNRTPEPLKRDTSTATVFAYLDTPGFHQPVPWVSNSHFDEDGLFSMFGIQAPRTALAHRDLLLAGALAGDFGVFTDRDGARLAFAIETLADPAAALLPPAVFAAADGVAALYAALLPRLPELLRDLPAQRPLWEAQDRFLADSERLIDSGQVSIRELSELDLAVVEIAPGLPQRPARRYLQTELTPVHPFAIHNRTDCTRILRIQGQRMSFQYRYETWLQLVSRRPLLRVGLRPLRDRLNALEGGRVRWLAESVGDGAPRLYTQHDAPSSLSADRLLDELVMALRTGTPGWDPYDWRPAVD